MNSDKIFMDLRSILEQYEPFLTVVNNKSDHYYLNTPIAETAKKAEFFGAVQIKKSYVAYHLMPIYYYPELLDNISEELRNYMHGKSCFNFKEVDEKLFTELNTLTKSCYDKYKLIGKV